MSNDLLNPYDIYSNALSQLLEDGSISDVKHEKLTSPQVLSHVMLPLKNSFALKQIILDLNLEKNLKRFVEFLDFVLEVSPPEEKIDITAKTGKPDIEELYKEFKK